MIFYTRSLGLREDDAIYRFNLARFFIGLFLVGGLIGASFLAKRMDWSGGADTLLDFSKIALGGLVGLLFGEKQALTEVRSKTRNRSH
uniref:hypothetical protein n=1 Tax=Bradyrhizobium sp. (strain ORS 278) TaxID=114615 RepID=UPI0005A140DE|nr:hypothetical protein [Bradyrhizobium sp. ORS 278]